MKSLEELELENKALRDYILKLTPYCDTCKFEEDEQGCDECNRKMFNWEHKDEISI